MRGERIEGKERGKRHHVHGITVIVGAIPHEVGMSLRRQGTARGRPCTITVQGLPHFSQYGFTEYVLPLSAKTQNRQQKK